MTKGDELRMTKGDELILRQAQDDRKDATLSLFSSALFPQP
jgi:hypothetical protein